jgi:hypothetical protein
MSRRTYGSIAQWGSARSRDLMHAAVTKGDLDMIRLLCYIGLSINRGHLECAARYNNINVMKLIMGKDLVLDDEWLKAKNIDFPGEKIVKFDFNPHSRKNLKMMKQYYDIAIDIDSVELFDYLWNIGIEIPYDIPELIVNVSGHGHKLFSYLFGKYHPVSCDILRRCLDRIMKTDNVRTFYQLIPFYDCYADLTSVERDNEIVSFLSRNRHFYKGGRTEMVRDLMRMVRDRQQMSRLYFAYHHSDLSHQIINERMEDLWSLGVLPPYFMARSLAIESNVEGILFCLKHDLFKSSEDLGYLYSFFVEYDIRSIEKIIKGMSKIPDADRYIEGYLEYDHAVISGNGDFGQHRIVLWDTIIQTFPHFRPLIVNMMMEDRRKGFEIYLNREKLREENPLLCLSTFDE